MQYSITYREKDKGIQFIISYKDSSGKWKQKSKQGFKGKREAKAAADKALEELKNDILLKSNLDSEYESITFKQYTDTFCRHQRLYKEANTVKSYKSAFLNFSELNVLLLSEIKTLDIQKCVDKLVMKNTKSSSIKIYLSKIQLLFKTAIEQNIISSSPVTNIKIPKQKNVKEKTALTESELDALLSKITNRKYYIISLLASKVGLRIGEILGLKWSDVDMKNSLIYVNEQFKLINDSESGIGELKSKNSKRIIPISPKTLKELKIFKTENLINANGTIFNYKSQTSISNALSQYYKKLNYNISVHELRHTYATILISNGVDFKTAAKLLGHSVDQTLHTYSHVNDDMFKKVSDMISNIF